MGALECTQSCRTNAQQKWPWLCDSSGEAPTCSEFDFGPSEFDFGAPPAVSVHLVSPPRLVSRRAGASSSEAPMQDAESSGVSWDADHTHANLLNRRDWSTEDVVTWLERHDLHDFTDAFRNHQITGDILLDVSRNDLKEMGIDSVGPRLRFEKAIQRLHRDITDKADAKILSEASGVGLRYILDHFQPDLTAALGNEFSSKTFYELEDEFWKREGAVGFLGSSAKICPRDGRRGCALVDALEPCFRGRATHFVSWCWAYTVGTQRDALDRWRCRNAIDPDRTFLWICFWCNNQRLVTIDDAAHGSEDFAATFKERLTSIGSVVIILDQYRSPHYLTRIWTVYEVYVLSGLPDVSVSMTMPNDAEEALATERVDSLMAHLAAVDAEHATAYRSIDEDAIKAEIRATRQGFDGVNKTVRRLIADLLSDRIHQFLNEV